MTINRFSRRPQATTSTATEEVAAEVVAEQQAPVVEQAAAAAPIAEAAAPVATDPVEEEDADADLPLEEDYEEELEEEGDDEQELVEEAAPVVETPAAAPAARQFRRGAAAQAAASTAPAADAEQEQEEEEENTGRKSLVTLGRTRREKPVAQQPRQSSLVSIGVVKRNAPKEHRPAEPGQRITNNEMKQRYLEALRNVPGLEGIQKADSDKLFKLTVDFLFKDVLLVHPAKLGDFLFTHKAVPARHHAAPISPNVTFIPDHEIIVCRVNKTELNGELDKTILVPSGDTYIPCFMNEAGELVQDDDRAAIVENYLALKAAK